MNPNFPPELAVAGAWLWESFGKDILEGSVSTIKNQLNKQWDKFEWAIASQRYRKRVYELYSTMRMLGIPSPVSVEGIYTDLHFLDKPTAFHRYDIVRLQREHDEKGFHQPLGDRTSAFDIVNKQDRLFILGKPGAGKTTLLKHLTLLAVKGEIGKIPIFVSLNDWANSKEGLKPFIERQFEICDFPDAETFIEEALLKKGRAIILFDGLDEVNEGNNKRNEITRFITDFTNQYPKNKYLITCRVAATDYSFERFSYVEIADFTNEQVNIFVKKWFNSQQEKGERFLKEIAKSEHRGLRELAQVPILLNLLCLNFDETLTFPPRQSEIYQEAIDALLKKWDSSRNIKRDNRHYRK